MFGEDVSTPVTYLATNKFYEAREDVKQQSDNEGELLHSVVENLLFIMKEYITDLETSMSFLTTRVLKIDVYDWERMRRTLRFVHCNLKEKICCGATKIDKTFTWLYALYELHHDMKSNTGGVMSMGLGVTHCRPSKNNLNMKSSTEAELVGTRDYVPYNIWYVMFMNH